MYALGDGVLDSIRAYERNLAANLFSCDRPEHAGAANQLPLDIKAPGRSSVDDLPCLMTASLLFLATRALAVVASSRREKHLNRGCLLAGGSPDYGQPLSCGAGSNV